jgi:peptidoglycan hydrolase-like protein with peptidoglycan-binding domain
VAEYAAIYRYFTVDLLSNEVLSEIPFEGVGYARAIKGAGNFSGSIPVNDETSKLGLYENTMPGNTAVFIVRNGICVWGGIIWSRRFDVVSRVLEVSASEFTSYLYHRRIWKTWSSDFGATLRVSGQLAEVTFDSGVSGAIVPDASIRLSFLDTNQVKYNGYYVVAASPAPRTTPNPTTTVFNLDGPNTKAKVKFGLVKSGTATLITEGPHGLSSTDTVQVQMEAESNIPSGTYKLTSVGGTNSDQLSFATTQSDIAQKDMIGEVTRPIPDGIYYNVTVSVQADTYDYIRNLIDGVFADFVGIEFANQYLEPGVVTSTNITNITAANGYAEIETEEPHGLAVGQAVRVKDLDVLYDGEHEVAEISGTEDNVFRFESAATQSSTAITVLDKFVDYIMSIDDNTVLVHTTADHGFKVGQKVEMITEFDLGSFSSAFNGIFEITTITDPKLFTYDVITPSRLPLTKFTQPLITKGATTYEVSRGKLTSNVATLQTASPNNLQVGDSITVSNANITLPIASKSLDAPSSTATLKTSTVHPLSVGDTIKVVGLRDSSQITQKTISGAGATRTVTITLQKPHNFRVGDDITITEMKDNYVVAKKQLTDGTATITTSLPHDIAVGSKVSISNLQDIYSVSKYSLAKNVATVTIAGAVGHNFKVNDEIRISNLRDKYRVISKEMDRGVITLTTDFAHNIKVSDKITVTGVGPVRFDGLWTVKEVTDTRISYDTKTAAEVVTAESNYQAARAAAISTGVANPDASPTVVAALNNLNNLLNGFSASCAPTAADGIVSSNTSIFNGTFKISEVPAGNLQVKFKLSGNSVTPTVASTFSATLSTGSATADTCTIFVSTVENLVVGDKITVTTANARFAGTFEVTEAAKVNNTQTNYRFAASGDWIEWQSLLTYVGYYAGPIDGIPGPNTYRGIYNFQSDYGLEVDGIIGPITEGALRALASYTTSWVTNKISYKFAGAETGSTNLSGSVTTVVSLSGPSIFNSATGAKFSVTARTSNTFSYALAGYNDVALVNVPLAVATGETQALASTDSVHNGTHVLTKLDGPTTASFEQALTTNVTSVPTSGVVTIDSIFNGVTYVFSRYASATVCSLVLKSPKGLEVGTTIIVSNLTSRYNGKFVITGVDIATRTITYSKAGAVEGSISAQVASAGLVEALRTITAVTDNSIEFRLARYTQNVLESSVTSPAYIEEVSVFNAETPVTITRVTNTTFVVSAKSVTSNVATLTTTEPHGLLTGDTVVVNGVDATFNGTYEITATPTTKSLSYAKTTSNVTSTSATGTISSLASDISFTRTHAANVEDVAIAGWGHATVYPHIEVATYGPYPANSDIGIRFSTRNYSGKNVIPTLYRGFELTNVGEALGKYADNIDGFEYRIDCSYDETTGSFTKTFVLIPIDFPAPPAPGDVSPISRFGADKTVFEYPGNIINLAIDESAENSATRFFAIGTDNTISVASAVDMLTGSAGRAWPLLDDDYKMKDIADKSVLYGHAIRYLTENRPPDASLVVSVNGSLDPVVGSYNPGDWCSLIVDNDFIRQRLQSSLEPRDNVIVRKIDSISVKVPDGSTFPETVDLILVPEWEVDKFGY